MNNSEYNLKYPDLIEVPLTDNVMIYGKIVIGWDILIRDYEQFRKNNTARQ